MPELLEEDVMTQAELKALPDYSCTFPTGTTIGKKWRRREPYETGRGIVNAWYTGEYVDYPDSKMVGVKWRKVVIR